MTFQSLGLCTPILAALEKQGYQQPSPIQCQAIPAALSGRDLLGCAQTGTGKTCAFAAPMLQKLYEEGRSDHVIRGLVLTPTRELAIQVGEQFSAYGAYLPLRCAVIFGGVSQGPQVERLEHGVDILVATPGRFCDLYQQGFLSVQKLEMFVLDEADRMLDMGFLHDVKKILNWLPAQKQTLFFSATMPKEVMEMVHTLLNQPVYVAVTPVSSPVEAIEQQVYFVDKANKTKLLVYLIEQKNIPSTIVFTRTKQGANRVARDLGKMGIMAVAIHGDKSQGARQKALSRFKSGEARCLVATDLAARGLDIDALSFVFNYHLPEVPETYVHRIGRSGRAGREGTAISFCEWSEIPRLKEIERLIGSHIMVESQHPFPMAVTEGGKNVQKEQSIHRKTGETGQPGKQVEQKKGKKHRHLEAIQKHEKMAGLPKQRKKAVRPGSCIQTGNAIPNTEVTRPNPLMGDQVMDATARLLAPKTMPKKKKEPVQPHRHREKKVQHTREAVAPQQKKNHPAPKRPERRPNKLDVPRGPVEPMKSGRVKDSTEQHSLMKPYYLEY